MFISLPQLFDNCGTQTFTAANAAQKPHSDMRHVSWQAVITYTVIYRFKREVPVHLKSKSFLVSVLKLHSCDETFTLIVRMNVMAFNEFVFQDPSLLWSLLTPQDYSSHFKLWC